MAKPTTQTFEIPETLTVSETARTLRLSRTSIDRLINSGKLRVYKIGKRHVLVNAEDVRSFFSQPSNFRVID
ncbi:helix-turn-helix domain-containing protein [Bifidobacterium tibiigranuli]|uniref:helix-turn-helix domain-containing protein n=1 Tax=Bifidobacterium tibiigranuli TaxID=2172043 RepID=UPI0026F2385F|nr:helix-turn-helix domain-containing protein [Bifidobacterium tibiigranuli]MCI2185207.1 helix-turn-helix domain-containing protein [Bifidobacterium tibiigranuli]MCI2203228.1 helix-turn-helix domain-containing protein [Bifidobacterium tibiigranuli]